MRRRDFVFSLATALVDEPAVNKDWMCPMDPDVRSDKPGKCPRCGMALVLKIPEREEYPVELSCSPALVRPNETVQLRFRVLNPDSGKTVTKFDIVHEKLMHIFLVSENLEFFAHEHPVAQTDGTFTLPVKLPYGGMYRVLADFYPTGSVPQLAVNTMYALGHAPVAHLTPSLEAAKGENLTASLHLEPAALLAGMENRLTFSLDPSEKLEPYLGAWGHMLAASSDLIDMLHIHPFLVRGGDIQFNVIFPRAGLYKIWTQFQRAGVVNTVVFTVPVNAL